MIERHEISALMKGVGDFMRLHVVAPLAAIVTRVEAVERSLKEIPAGPPGPAGKDAAIDHDKVAALINSEVMVAVKALPVPKDGLPGKDIDPEVVRQLILAEVAKIPPAKDGVDGTHGLSCQIDHDFVISEITKKIPTPKDGKDVSPEQIRETVLTEVTRAVAELPKPKDGEDAPPVDLDTVVLKVLEMVPTPKDGTVGPKGETGERGESGLTGKDGERGEIGSTGIAGPIGPKGEAGEKGDAGLSVKGDPGERGERGERGEKGESGLSIKGEKGDPGTSGIDGKDGQSVHPDTVSLMIVNEVKQAVAAIPRAKDGENGRDAIQVEILPSIDETRSYPRGTYAEHAGGTIRATRNTDPVTDGLEKAGWAISKDGFADVVEVPNADPRHILIEIKRTSGKKTVIERHIPFMVFKEIWREGGSYVRGDAVQRNGTQWCCIVDGTRVAPGTPNNNDWILLAKKGSPGKDMDPESIRLMIETEVAKAVARLPKPRDGRDLTQMNWDGSKH